MTQNYNFKKMVERASNEKRLTSMRVSESEGQNSELYTIRLEGAGNRKGISTITIRKNDGDVTLEDCVSLPSENRGYEPDICLLKQTMFRDLGAVAAGAVTGLTYRGDSKGHTLRFRIAKREDTQKALFHYMDIAFEVMDNFFREHPELELAFSLARQRIGR